MGLVRLKYYDNNIEANRDKQLLADYGIESYIANEQTIQSDWLLSQAIGGIQLQVFEENLQQAESILHKFYKDEKLSLKVEFEIDNPEFDFRCPNCNSNHIYRYEKPNSLFGISWLLIGIPIKMQSSKYICYYCEHEFIH